MQHFYTRKMSQEGLTQQGTWVALPKVYECRWAPVMPLPLAQPGSALKDSQSHEPAASEPVSEHVVFLDPMPRLPHDRLDSAQSQGSICTVA